MSRALRTIAWLFGSGLNLVACSGGDGGDAVPQQQPAEFRSLGFLPGYALSQAAAVSSDGTVIVGTVATTAGSRQAFRWNVPQGMVGLGFIPGGTSSRAAAVSANGSVIVGDGDGASLPTPTARGVFRWTADTGMQTLDPLPGANLCAAGGVSGDGSIVAGTCLRVNDEAFRWTAGTGTVGLGRFGTGSNQTSSAAAVSRDGSAIAGAGHPVLTGAVLWTSGSGALVLGKPDGDASAAASAVSGDGTVVVGSSMTAAQNYRAFRWTSQAGMRALDVASPGIRESYATAVSGNGEVVVGWGVTPAGEAALIWDANHGWRTLEAALSADYRTPLAGWTLTRATAISDDAHTIAGYGTNPQGQTEAWRVKLSD